MEVDGRINLFLHLKPVFGCVRFYSRGLPKDSKTWPHTQGRPQSYLGCRSRTLTSLRRLAGYHVTPGDKSALEYSRDAAAPVLRQIEAIFIAIPAHLFKPDETRTKRWNEVQTLEDAVKLVAWKPHLQNCTSSRSFAFGSMFSESESVNHSADMPHEEVPDSGTVWPGFGDDTRLLELRDHALREIHPDVQGQFQTCASDISDSPMSAESDFENDSSSDDAERRVELDGDKNARGLIAPSNLAEKGCFRHVKSRKLHLVRAVYMSDRGFFFASLCCFVVFFPRASAKGFS
eukprot:s2321_g10.t1